MPFLVFSSRRGDNLQVAYLLFDNELCIYVLTLMRYTSVYAWSQAIILSPYNIPVISDLLEEATLNVHSRWDGLCGDVVICGIRFIARITV